MKTSRIILAITFITMISFGTIANANGFDKGRKERKENRKIQEEDLNLYYEDPTPLTVNDFDLPQTNITVRVINTKGDLVMENEIRIENFFANENNLENLPKNSLFVIFYNNTAYYILDSESK